MSTKGIVAASESLFDTLMRRSQERQQQLIDGITINSRLQAEARAQTEAKRQAVVQAAADADRLAAIHGPSADLDAPTAAALKGGGYRIDERTSLPARVIAAPVAPGIVMPARDLPVEPYSRRQESFSESLARQARESQQQEREEARRFRDAQADAERAFRGEQSAASRASAKERADSDRDTRELIAQSNRQARLAITPTSEAAMIARLQTQWDKANGAQREMTRQASIMRTGLARFDADPNGGSQAVLITFQKILDPTSVVRESEYARSAEGTSLISRIEGYKDRLAKGGAGMTKSDLAAMVATADAFMRGLHSHTQGIRQRAERTADRYGIPHDLIFDDDGAVGGGAVSGGAGASGSTDTSVVRWGRDANGRPVRMQ